VRDHEQRDKVDYNTLRKVARAIVEQIARTPDEKDKQAIIEKLLNYCDVSFVYALDFAYEMSPKPQERGQDKELDELVSGMKTPNLDERQKSEE
jgi:hypothetical protein